MFNFHKATFALIVFLESFPFRSAQFQKLSPTPQSLKPRINPRSDLAEHVTVSTRSKVRVTKVYNVHSKYSGTAEKAFDHNFKP